MVKIDSSNCPTYRVKCGNEIGNVFLYEKKFLTVRHVVADAIQPDGTVDDTVDIHVTYNNQDVLCGIMLPRKKELALSTMIVLIPKDDRMLGELSEELSICLFEEIENITQEGKSIGYIGDQFAEFDFSHIKLAPTRNVDQKEEAKNYTFTPVQRVDDFTSLSGSPFFIDNCLFGVVNHQSSSGKTTSTVEGFCGKVFFEELQVEYGIQFRSRGGMVYPFEKPTTVAGTAIEAVDFERPSPKLPELPFSDQMAKDCFDSYGADYQRHWFKRYEDCGNLLYFNRLMNKAVKPQSDPAECVNMAIRYLLDETFLSDNVEGIERPERASWILGDKYWELYTQAENLDQYLLLKRMLQVVPDGIPDNPQRSLLLGIIAYMEETEYEEAEEILQSADAQCVGIWENSNCHAEIHSFLGCIILNRKGPGDDAAAHFSEAKKRFRDQLRLAEQYRRSAHRLMNVGNYVDAIEMYKQAIAINMEDPIDLEGILVSYERILEACFRGFQKAGEVYGNGQAIQYFKHEAIDTFDKFIQSYPAVYPGLDSDSKISAWAGKLFRTYAMMLGQKGMSYNTIQELIKFGTQLHLNRETVLNILFVQTRVQAVQRLGLSNYTDDQQQLVVKCIISALIEGTVEELESDNVDALIVAMLEVLFALGSTPGWTERTMAPHLCQVFGIADRNGIRFGVTNSASKHATMYAEMSRSALVEPFLSECVLEDVSQLVTITYITADKENLFDELWRMVRKKLFRSVLKEFVASKPDVASIYRFCDSQIRVCPCTYKHRDGKLIHSMHFFCHIRG